MPHRPDTPHTCPRDHSRRPGPVGWWFLLGSTVTGILALLWVALRSGTRPSRLAYPCQQAALATAAATLGAPFAALALALRRCIASGMRRPVAAGVLVAAVVVALGVTGSMVSGRVPAVPGLLPSPGYRARLFTVDHCPQEPVGDRFAGLDALVELMGLHGLKLHRSATYSLTSGPDGIVGDSDVVIIKINYQWPERGGTNTDLLRGLIRAILDHPDGFSGEIVVCENSQFNSIDAFDRADNNAQDTTQSPHDVVADFAGAGFPVSHTDWTVLRYTQVDEYSAGDLADGYVVYPWNSEINGCVSYPKFTTAGGAMVSLRDGIWDPGSSTYDRDRLTVINLPVLKSHGAVYGATACVKHYMGLVTRELGSNSHSGIASGLLGEVMAEIGPPDLNILDAIWINADPTSGPWTTYAEATRRDTLVASTDPVAADIWSVRSILIPAFLANGFTPPWPSPSADPDDPASAFRIYLDHSMNRLINAGIDVTNDASRTDVFSADASTFDPIFGDGFESGTTAAWSAK